jgi:hypothetical protein
MDLLFAFGGNMICCFFAIYLLSPLSKNYPARYSLAMSSAAFAVSQLSIYVDFSDKYQYISYILSAYFAIIIFGIASFCLHAVLLIERKQLKLCHVGILSVYGIIAAWATLGSSILLIISGWSSNLIF